MKFLFDKTIFRGIGYGNIIFAIFMILDSYPKDIPLIVASLGIGFMYILVAKGLV